MNPAPTRSRTKITRLRVIGIVITLAAGTIWLQDLTSRPDLRKGKREPSMWRSYYEGRWARLGWDAFRLSRSEYGFSWRCSGRASACAALAALHFRRNTNDPRCLPLLEKYYQVTKNGASGEIPVAEAAKREPEWWRERRRKLPPEEFAKTITRLASLIYGGETARYLDASEKRVLAMKFRDDHREVTMEEADWEHVSGMLQSAHTSLKDSLSGPTGESP